jgi:hypothetical protein
MDALTLIPILIIACIGFTVITIGMWNDSKNTRQKLLREERREIIDAIMNIRPFSANPDVVEIKDQVIDAIIKRNLK